MSVILPPSVKADLLTRLADDPNERTLDRLAGDLGLLLPEAKALVQKHGWPRPESMRRAAQVLLNPTSQRIRAESPPAVSQEQPVGILALLAAAKQSPSKRIQAAAQKAQDAIAKVRALVDAEEAKVAEHAKADAAKRAARSEVERLERQLAQAKAKLRGPSSKPTSSAGTPAKIIRAWAADNGVTCPAVGRVPAVVVEAYESAQSERAS